MVYVGIQRSEEDVAGVGGWISLNTQCVLQLIKSGHPMDPELRLDRDMASFIPDFFLTYFLYLFFHVYSCSS